MDIINSLFEETNSQPTRYIYFLNLTAAIDYSHKHNFCTIYPVTEGESIFYRYFCIINDTLDED